MSPNLTIFRWLFQFNPSKTTGGKYVVLYSFDDDNTTKVGLVLCQRQLHRKSTEDYIKRVMIHYHLVEYSLLLYNLLCYPDQSFT